VLKHVKHLEVLKVLVVAKDPLLLVYHVEYLLFNTIILFYQPSPDAARSREEVARNTAAYSDDHNWQVDDA